MATIQDIAKHAGISIATVSRALNKPEMVNVETRERVMHAAKKLNYFANENTKLSNVKNKKLSLGIIIPYITAFYFGELYSGISKVAEEHNIDLLLYELKSQHMSNEGISKALSFVKQRMVDGIILASCHVPGDYEDLIEQVQIPIALVLSSHENGKLPAFKVDDIRSSFDAVAYLVSRGHRHIGMISALPTEPERSEQLRFRGYKQAIDFYNLPYSDSFVAFGDMRFDDGYVAMKQLLANNEKIELTAVFAASDEMAIGAMRCIHDAGLRVPEDISVIGYDNLSVGTMTTPTLTTIEQPFGQIGSESVRHLMKVLTDSGQVTGKGNFYLPHKIIERESVSEITLSAK
ncbi:LacI family DNA-binding transcriptional regulator [Paenibacillus wynnii]|uniref:LacI family DNA-binding transcriptional regulator n=1 Tax=Paenibacillus wynnii TaxID=268407 RepID=UPI0027946E6C|nr:LacI family DNA-binding transcriptional regulator [Paenibacillus wynnii]MDQ0194889.1 LacI family transcriptional regulator [Paenibacillus wynnii]